MSYTTHPHRHDSAPNNGRYTVQARRAAAQVRARAEAGEPCWFWRRDPMCPGPGWDWTLPHQHRHAYTTHHLHRLMDGGIPDADPAHMAPAHRGCNSRDGLVALNARRQGRPPPTGSSVTTGHRSREW